MRVFWISVLGLALWGLELGAWAQGVSWAASGVGVQIPAVLYLKTPSGERAPELFLPPGKWDLEVVANTSWLLVVHGAPLGVQVLSVWPSEGGLVDLAYPGLVARAGESNPEEGGLFAAAPLGHNGLDAQGSLLLARGKKRARVALFLPTASRVAVVSGR